MPVHDSKNVSNRLLSARISSGLSRESAARQAGLSDKTLQRVEARGTDSRYIIRRLAEVYGVHPIRLGYSNAELREFLMDLLEAEHR